MKFELDLTNFIEVWRDAFLMFKDFALRSFKFFNERSDNMKIKFGILPTLVCLLIIPFPFAVACGICNAITFSLFTPIWETIFGIIWFSCWWSMGWLIGDYFSERFRS